MDDNAAEYLRRTYGDTGKCGTAAIRCIRGPIDAVKAAEMKRMLNSGYVLAACGLKGLKPDAAIETLGEKRYLEEEIRPQLVAAEKAGVPLRYFAYPKGGCGARAAAFLRTRFDGLVEMTDGDDLVVVNDLDFPFGRISRSRLLPGFDGKYCKMSPNVATDFSGTALMTYGILLLSGSDVFYGNYIAKSTDGGETWSAPKKVESLKDTFEGDVRTTYSAGVRYARKAKRWYAFGVSTTYRGDSHPLDERHNGKPFRLPYFYNVDPETLEFGPGQVLELPFDYDVAIPFAALEEEDGTILMSYYLRSEQAKLKPGAYTRPTIAVTMRYRFEGEGLKLVAAGEPISDDSLLRGVGEPSVVKFGGKYLMTIRSDERGMVAESFDGLKFGKLKTWGWEDGTPIWNRNTQQHWLVLKDGLYLSYTREGATNDHVFRNRAPVFMAKVDPAKLCLVRSTEIPLVPEYGARLGNFSTVWDGAGSAWLLTAEWMQPKGCEKFGSDNALWLIRIR